MDWNQRYLNEDTPWDKGAPSPVITELIEKLPDYFQANHKVLMPGCGRGHDAIPFLKQGLNVTGVDISAEAIKEASTSHPSATWLERDIFNMPGSHSEAYDLIWEHTCYCAILPSMREQYLDAITPLIKPGGYLIGPFFMNTGLRIEEGPPFFTTRDQVITNFERELELIWEAIPDRSYPGREGRERVMIWQKKFQ